MCEHAISALSAGTTISAPRYNTVLFSPLCGAPSVGVSSPGGGTRVPFYLVGDVVAYLSSPGEALPTTLPGGGSLPLPPLGLRGLPVGTWGLLIIRYVCVVAILPIVYSNKNEDVGFSGNKVALADVDNYFSLQLVLNVS